MREGKHVIVHVDDSLTARALVYEALSAAGFAVHSAESAEDLEHRLLSDEGLRGVVDLFVLDMEMPDMMGAQVGAAIEAVYEDLAKVPFIIYSGKDEDWVEKMSADVAELSEEFKKNYKGYVGKGQKSTERLLQRVKEVLLEDNE